MYKTCMKLYVTYFHVYVTYVTYSEVVYSKKGISPDFLYRKVRHKKFSGKLGYHNMAAEDSKPYG
jgi:hypothetical protein